MKHFFLSGSVIVLSLGFFLSCNNPFSTREPNINNSEGAAIKPPKSPENVLYNLEVAFEALSIQDYLDVFSEDFIFHPDPADSLEYEEEFRGGWYRQKEEVFANNFLQPNHFGDNLDGSPIDVFARYEYKPGLDMYEYNYTMFVIHSDSTGTQTSEIEGRAWLYLREDDEGKWSIYQWVDYRLRAGSITWGILRAENI